MTFPTAQHALDYLKANVRDLFAARGVLQDKYGKLLIAKSKQTGARAAAIDSVIQDLLTLLENQTTLENRVRRLVPSTWIEGLGLVPLIPIAVLVGAAVVAGEVYLHLQRVRAYAATVNLIHEGKITAEQGKAMADRLESSTSLLGASGLAGLTSNLGTILIAGAAILGLILIGPLFKRT